MSGSRTPSSLAMAGGPTIVPVPFFLGLRGYYSAAGCPLCANLPHFLYSRAENWRSVHVGTGGRNAVPANSKAGRRANKERSFVSHLRNALTLEDVKLWLLHRRKFLGLTAAAVGCLAFSPATSALDYPTRPVHFIVSFAAGGPNDTIARMLGQYLSEYLGQQFVVENRVGAGGNIGMEVVLSSPPDGYTIGFVAPNNAINTTLYEHLPFDFLRDSTPVAGTMKLANVMDVNLSFPAKNLADGETRRHAT